MEGRRGDWVLVGLNGVGPDGAIVGWGVHASLQQSPYGCMCALCSKSEGAHTVVGAIIDHVSLSHLLIDLTIKKKKRLCL